MTFRGEVHTVAPSAVQRKLTAILCADVVGYSRPMGENEEATLRTLTEYRRVFSGTIDKFRGRIANAPGDSILAGFGGVVDAVEGATEIQRELGGFLKSPRLQAVFNGSMGALTAASISLLCL